MDVFNCTIYIGLSTCMWDYLYKKLTVHFKQVLLLDCCTCQIVVSVWLCVVRRCAFDSGVWDAAASEAACGPSQLLPATQAWPRMESTGHGGRAPAPTHPETGPRHSQEMCVVTECMYFLLNTLKLLWPTAYCWYILVIALNMFSVFFGFKKKHTRFQFCLQLWTIPYVVVAKTYFFSVSKI